MPKKDTVESVFANSVRSMVERARDSERRGDAGCVQLFVQELRLLFRNEQARRALEWAKIGDWDTLAQHIREGGKITKGIAGFLAGVLEGSERRPANKARTHGAMEKIAHLVRGVAHLMIFKGLNQSAAIDELAEQEKISRRTVERALGAREWVLDGEIEDWVERRCLKFTPNENELRAIYQKSKRYMVSDAGLSTWQGATGPRQDVSDLMS